MFLLKFLRRNKRLMRREISEEKCVKIENLLSLNCLAVISLKTVTQRLLFQLFLNLFTQGCDSLELSWASQRNTEGGRCPLEDPMFTILGSIQTVVVLVH